MTARKYGRLSRVACGIPISASGMALFSSDFKFSNTVGFARRW
jgi:hypothetical protein